MRLQDLVIPIGTQISNEIDVLHIDDLTVFGPAVLTGTIDIEISPDKGVTWFDTTLNIAINASTRLHPVHGGKVRLNSDMNEVAARTFKVHGSSLVTV